MLFIKGIYLLLSHLPTSHTTGGCLHHRIAPTAQYTAMRKNRRRAVSYVSTGLACLPRDTNASPIYRRRAVVYVNTSLGLHSLVAERRHSSVTRYAKRSVACRDSPRHQPLRAGGTPLPHLRRLPPTSSATHRIAHPHRPPSIYMRFGDALLRRPRKRSRLQLTPDRVGGTRTDTYAPRSAAAERSIAKCRKLGRR